MTPPERLPVTIRPATEKDHGPIWAMLAPVFREGETYCLPRDIGRDAALDYWTGGNHRVFIAEVNSKPLGTYFLCPNQQGGGAHICNCGFVTDRAAQGKGLARTMLDHALDTARAAGFRAMQFNFVVETNSRAIAIWQSHGFAIAGRLPDAFASPAHGFVDALVMHRTL